MSRTVHPLPLSECFTNGRSTCKHSEHLLPATEGAPAGLKGLIAYTYGDVPAPVPAPSDEERDPRTDEHATYQARVLANARYFQGKALLTPKNNEAEDRGHE